MFVKNNFSIILKKFNYFNSYGFATKMRQGITKNNKDSAGKRLGLKKYGGEEIRENQIILRQRGFKWKPGENVHYGRDHTLHASKEGIIKFSQDPWSRRRKVFVSVVEQEIPNRKLYPPKPFMYHPELYPELAKNNLKQEKLEISSDIKNREISNERKKMKKMNEVTFITHIKFDNNSDKSYQNLVIQSSKNCKKIHHDNYTSKYDIEPILEEISDTGVKYFIPNFNNQSEKNIDTLVYAEYSSKNNLNPSPLGLFNHMDQTYNVDINEINDFTNISKPYSYFSEVYAKNVNENQTPLALRDLMIEMKKEGLMNPRQNITSVPYPNLSNFELQQAVEYHRNNIIEDLNSKLKIAREDLDKVEITNDEEMYDLITQYNLNSREEIISYLNKEIILIEKRLQKLIQVRSKNYSLEKRKKELPGILKNCGITEKKGKTNRKNPNLNKKLKV